MSEPVITYRRAGDRPERDYVTGRWTRRIRRASTALMIVGVVVGLGALPLLGEEVPIHFGFDGVADGWGARWELVGVLALWAVIQVGIDLLSRRPRIMNFPTVLTSRNVQRAYREGERMLVIVGAASSLCFAGGVAMTLGAPGLPLMIGGLVLMFAGLIVGVVRLGNVS